MIRHALVCLKKVSKYLLTYLFVNTGLPPIPMALADIEPQHGKGLPSKS
jgi:hypothetical protein